MRPKERIRPFLEKVDLKDLFANIWKLPLKEDAINFWVELVKEKTPELTRIWLKNQDWRFSQLLINTGFFANYTGWWYNLEEYEILVKQGHRPQDVNYWGVYFFANGKERKKPVYKPISKLSTNHIKAILDGGYVRYNSYYTKLFKEELIERNEEN